MNKSRKIRKSFVFGTLLSISVLAGCDPSATHQHSFAEEWSKDENQHWHACTGEGCTERTGIENHNPSDWIVDSPATYDSEGTQHKECTVCEKVLETGIIPVKGHNFSTVWESDATGHWHKCTDVGYETLTTTKEQHTYSEFIPDSGKTATIFAGGSETRTCTVCGYEDTRTTDPIDMGVVTEDIQRVDLYNSVATGGKVKAGEITKVIDGVYTVGGALEDQKLASTGSGTSTRLSLNGPANTDGTRTVAFKVGAPVTMYISAASVTKGSEVTFGVFDGLPNAERTNFVGGKTYSTTSSTNEWYQFDIPAAGLYTFGASVGKTKVNFFTFEFHVNRSEWKSDATNHWHELSCDVNTNFPTEGNAYADKAEHTWDEGVVSTPASCGVAGEKTFTCTVCRATRTEAITALEHDFSDDSLICKNGCGAFRAAYNGQYYEMTESDRVPFVMNTAFVDNDYKNGRIYTTDKTKKANIAASAVANPLTFIVHASGSNDKSSVSFAEDGSSYSMTLTTSDKIFQNFTRFSYKPDFKGTMLVSFEMSVDKEVESVTGAGLYVQDLTFTNIENRSPLVGANGAITMVPGKTYRFVYRVELKDHANETLAIAANQFKPATGILPTLTVSNLRMKEISTTEPETASVYLLSFTEDAPLALADCTHLTKQAVATTATCSTDGILAHDHCLTCGKNFIGDTEVSNITGKLPHEAGLNPEWQKDETGHWHNCEECGEKMDFAGHTPDPNATPGVDDVYCTVCNYKISEGTQKCEHNMQLIPATPSCAESGMHDAYYKCSICSKCFSDEAGENLINEPVNTRDIIGSNHTFDDQGVCTACGAVEHSIPFVAHADESANNNAQHSKANGNGKAAYVRDNIGYWTSAPSTTAPANFYPNSNEELYIAGGGKANNHLRIVPFEGALTAGSTYLIEFDIRVGDDETESKLTSSGFTQNASSTSVGQQISQKVNLTPGEKQHMVFIFRAAEDNLHAQIKFDASASSSYNIRLYATNGRCVEYPDGLDLETGTNGCIYFDPGFSIVETTLS